MPELAKASGAYAVHSRVAGLRSQGYTIHQQSRRLPGSKTIHSYYKLVDKVGSEPIPNLCSAATPTSSGAANPLSELG